VRLKCFPCSILIKNLKWLYHCKLVVAKARCVNCGGVGVGTGLGLCGIVGLIIVSFSLIMK